jgi:lysyl-tRNA synthetase class 2
VLFVSRQKTFTTFATIVVNVVKSDKAKILKIFLLSCQVYHSSPLFYDTGMALEDIREERIKKLALLRARGMDPYPADTGAVIKTADARKKFATLAKAKKETAVAGRIMARREHGGSAFFDVADASGTLQVYAKQDILGDEQYRLLADTVDIGDFMRVSGTLFLTKKEEMTLEMRSWVMLAKSLRPLPEKWHGLQDAEERFRRRYLDILMNEETRARFAARAAIIAFIRKFHEKRGFLEVETPILQAIPGGTLAKPFVTHHNALDIDLYLRIAPELYLKRLLVAGYEKVFEIGKSFRNEGIDATHNPEFTEPESYVAYWNEEDMMNFTEDMFTGLAKHLGKQKITADGKEIIFKKPFVRVSFRDMLARYALIPDYDSETRDSLAVRGRQFGIDIAPHAPKGKIADEIYKKICRPHVVQPTFLTQHPIDISPLAKRWPDRPGEVRRFQLIAGGSELTNAFAELNDPLDQRERFEAQERERQSGEDESMHMDRDFLEAMEYGMPPAAGLGIGIDRVVMLFTGASNIREVVLFPTMRPKV